MKRYRISAFIYIAIILTLLIASVLSFIQYRSNVNHIIEDRVHEELKKYTSQSVELVNYIIDDYFRQLDILAELCSSSNPDTRDSLLDTLQKMNTERTYVDFAIVDKEGILYDGSNIQDVSSSVYFQNAIKGERYISKISRDKLNPTDYIVFAIPIYIGDQVDGVVASRYEIEEFMELISNTQFEGKGTIMIMAEDGTMVSGYEGMENYENLYDALSVPEFQYDNAFVMEEFKENVEHNISGFFRYTGSNDKYRYVYYQPIDREGWTMISLVMAESLQNQYQEITQQSYLLMIVNMIIFFGITLLIWQLYRKIKQASIESQLDPLTGTYNKISSKTICESYLKYSGKEKQHACFFLDIDNFKDINDTYGHACGDTIIKDFSTALKSLFRSSDVISRFGGDEFFIFMKETPNLNLVEQKAREIGDCLRDHEPSATISIGIALYPQDGSTYAQLQKHADEALYKAKGLHRDTYVFYQDITKE